MQRRRALINSSIAVFGAAFPLASICSEDRYAPFRGQVIRISVPIHPHYDAMIKLLPAFTEKTGIKVDVYRVSVANMKAAQVESLSKSSGNYDLVSYVVTWKSEYVHRKLLRELDPFFRNSRLADPDFDLADISKDYLENIGLVGGWRGYLQGPEARLYGLPYGAETSILAYRTDLFSRHGLRPPNTYFELEYLLGNVREKTGVAPLCTRSLVGHQCVHAWLLHLNPMGGKVFDVRWQSRVNDSAGVRALNFLRRVVETGPDGGANFGQAEMMGCFLDGGAAMYLDSTIVFGAIRDPKLSKVEGKVGFLRHPKATKYASQSGGLGLGIPTNSKNPEAAFLLMQWLTSKDQDKAIARLGGTPQRTTTLQDESLCRQFPELITLRTQLRDIDPDWRPLIPEWDEINEKILGVSIGAVLRGNSSPQKALDSAAVQVDALMRRNGYL